MKNKNESIKNNNVEIVANQNAKEFSARNLKIYIDNI